MKTELTKLFENSQIEISVDLFINLVNLNIKMNNAVDFDNAVDFAKESDCLDLVSDLSNNEDIFNFILLYIESIVNDVCWRIYNDSSIDPLEIVVK